MPCAVIHGVRTRNDTLGPEFFSTRSAFGGFLTGLTPASRAKQVYAGETCFFR
jgi:hypothetical protein